MDILDILLDILLKPPQPFIGLFFLHNLLRSRVYSYPSSSVSGQFYPVFPSCEFLLLAAYTVTFVLVTATCQLKLAVFAFSILFVFYLYKAIFLWFLQLRRCLFIIIFKHRDQTVSTAKRIYLVGLVLFKKVRILYVNLSSGKVTFVIISFLFFLSFSFINLVSFKHSVHSFV